MSRHLLALLLTRVPADINRCGTSRTWPGGLLDPSADHLQNRSAPPQTRSSIAMQFISTPLTPGRPVTRL